MQQAGERSPALRAMIACAGVIIVPGGMKLSSGLLAPIIFAVFVAILCLLIMRWLQGKGWPTWAALVLLIVGVLMLGVALILFIFLSFFIWAYIFGAVGGLLSVPLTLLVKLLLEASADTRWLAVLMDDTVPTASANAPDMQAAHEVAIPDEALDQTRRENA